MASTNNERDETTKTIALVLLWAFIGSVSLLFIANLFIHKFGLDDDDLQKGWFDLLKNALVLLATALTTVIGYYFGQKEGSIKAEQAAKEIKETDQKAENAVQQAFQQRDDAIKNTVTNTGNSQDADSPPDQTGNGVSLPK